MNIVARIGDIRRAKGISQATLADMVDISRSFLCDIEKGRSEPSVGNAFRIAAALRVSIADLAEDRELPQCQHRLLDYDGMARGLCRSCGTVFSVARRYEEAER